MAPRATRRAEDATVAPAPYPREIVAEGFRSFLHENFSGPYHVARAFYVEDRTAEYWWQGKHAPNGVMVCLAFGMYPESAARHLRLDAASFLQLKFLRRHDVSSSCPMGPA
jgi:hypothetical protein